MTTESAAQLKLISADSHIIEPVDLWTTRLPKEYRDRGPRIESRMDGDYKLADGLPPWRISGAEGGMAIQKGAGEDITKERVYRYSDQRPGAVDPQARLGDQDADGVVAEVIYPGWLQVGQIPDPELRAASMRVYNDWIAEFCSAAPGRFVGAAQLPLVPGRLDDTIAEARRARELGLGSLMLPHVPEMPYHDAAYDPLWAAFEEIGLPVAIHISTGMVFNAKTFKSGGIAGTVGVTKSKTGVSAPAIELIWAAVPQRHPGLKFVMTEGGIGWIAFVLRFMDHWWADHRHRIDPPLDETPSFYFHRSFWATFEDDRPGILTLPLLNEDHLMWASDYPHTEGTFPHCQRQVERDMADLSEATRRKLVYDNVSALYGMG